MRGKVRRSSKIKDYRVTLVLTTFPDEVSALNVANKLVNSGLCACASLSKTRSIYQWKGKINDEQEIFVIFKTSQDVATSLKEEISKIHPYEVPEILEIATASSTNSYLEWILNSTQGVAQKRHNASK